MISRPAERLYALSAGRRMLRRKNNIITKGEL